ncbi:Inositol-pentakisphosphate 2-kinase [Maublancomyces gigas]|uniref:Inositol-pentakisphosphate 2-kinase n=1 Tax=Discina gigas TaxID=1032678 RepID=A0ABR3GV73_9PEZI
MATNAPPPADVPPPADASSASASAVPALPADISLRYLAEGAANVIYRLSSPAGAPQFTHQLLRARKALPSTQPNQLSYAQLLHTFQPMFPAHLLLPTTLIRLPPSLLAHENTALIALEAAKKRPAKRHGLYLEPSEEFGYLIMDMSPHPITTPPPSPSFLARAFARLPRRHKPSSSSSSPHQQTRQLLIEFKPKWVLQSPSAAASPWRRCRTCALRLSKNQKPGFCPLDMASGSEERVRRAVAFLVPAVKPAGLVLRGAETWDATRVTVAEHVVRYLVGGDLMPTLKGLHGRLDPYGPVGMMGRAEEERKLFMTAMTVRDLTVFLRIDLDGREGEIEGVEAKVGDLDLKTGAAGKWEYWEGVERTLMEGGWYGGSEEGAEEKGVWCMP